ncbi:MAG TPA: class F sortase [Nitriliruptoraceae bacterium]|nr:class F sortase [Nitriliruptoraceae bacterium]
MDRRLLAGTGAAALAAAAFLWVSAATGDVGEVDLTGGATPVAAASPSSAPVEASSTPPASRPTNIPTPSPTPATTPSPTPTPVPAPTPVIDVGTSSARLADVDLTAAPAPTRLAIPSIDVDVPVAALGIDSDGQMAIPEDVDEAGWYRFGPSPGQPGNAVIAGHVDSRSQGLGAFHRLNNVAIGDVVRVTASDGSTADYEITGRQEIDKDVLATDDLFRRDGPAQLVLVTCGGDFDADVRSYRSNVVVVADPL